MISTDVTKDRHLYIGGSDAKRIVDGDWHNLYMEKTQQAEREDLSNVFRVQLGAYTEPFHLDWLEKREGWSITDRNQAFQSDKYKHMACHTDGMIVHNGLPIEVKHSHGMNNARDGAIYYMPQLQHIMIVLDVDTIMFSIIAGNNDPECVPVQRNIEFAQELIELEASFWWHVENQVPPEIMPTGKTVALNRVAAKTVINNLKPYDMTGNNEWAQMAADYLENQEASVKFEAAKKNIKTLVPDDASECSGHDITIKRDKRGALRFS